jgi:hypothetical protein
MTVPLPALPPAPDFAAWMTSPTAPCGITSTSSMRTSSATLMRNRSPGLFLLEDTGSSMRIATAKQ